MPNFPTYAKTEAPRCFNCDVELHGEDRDDGYPYAPFSRECAQCGMRTWFDRKS